MKAASRFRGGKKPFKQIRDLCHVHGIIIINKPDVGNDGRNDEPPKVDKTKNQFDSQSQNLASIVRGFKIGVTKNAREINPGFAWQARYHGHIIRNNESFERISEYINNNPANWKVTSFSPHKP